MINKTLAAIFFFSTSGLVFADTTITYSPYIPDNSYDVYESYGPPSGYDSSYYGIGSSYEYYSPNSTIIIKDRVIPNYRPKTVYYIERPPRPLPPRHDNRWNDNRSHQRDKFNERH